jgi:competence protein ComEC
MPGLDNTLSIVDVGHGNCAVLVDTNGTVVIDAGPGTALLEFLQKEGINKVDVVLISHADKDHIEGLIALVSSGRFELGVIRINSDALKTSKLWDDLLYSLNKAHIAGAVDFNPSLTIADTGKLDQGEVHIEILAPNLYIAGRGPGSRDRASRRLTSNSISAVIRLLKDGEPIATFTGDLDSVGLTNLLEDTVDCTAPVLVFPHHGGKPGDANMTAFVQRLVALVRPQTVIFSIRRGGKFSNPQPEIVTALRQHTPNVRIACTQLSTHCAADLPPTQPTHLTDQYAQGRQANSCCGGTFVIKLDDENRQFLPLSADHTDFIQQHAETALCQATQNPKT